MSALIRFHNKLILQNIIKQRFPNVRQIKTSQKKSDTPSACLPGTEVKDEDKFENKNWVSYGFETKNRTDDRKVTQATYFFSVTLCLVWGTFIWAYLPDNKLRDWALREAYLELRRRENAGADLISPNYIDPKKIKLPSDDELGDTEIII